MAPYALPNTVAPYGICPAVAFGHRTTLPNTPITTCASIQRLYSGYWGKTVARHRASCSLSSPCVHLIVYATILAIR